MKVFDQKKQDQANNRIKSVPILNDFTDKGRRLEFQLLGIEHKEAMETILQALEDEFYFKVPQGQRESVSYTYDPETLMFIVTLAAGVNKTKFLQFFIGNNLMPVKTPNSDCSPQ